jgi:hypothetical protein
MSVFQRFPAFSSVVWLLLLPHTSPITTASTLLTLSRVASSKTTATMSKKVPPYISLIRNTNLNSRFRNKMPKFSQGATLSNCAGQFDSLLNCLAASKSDAPCAAYLHDLEHCIETVCRSARCTSFYNHASVVDRAQVLTKHNVMCLIHLDNQSFQQEIATSNIVYRS